MFKIIEKSKIWFSISLAIILIGVVLMFTRGLNFGIDFKDGKVIGREHFIFENTANEGIGEIIEDFIGSFYGGTAKIPKAIYVPQIDNFDLMEEYLTIKRGSKVWIKVPQKGQKKKCLKWLKTMQELL